MRRVGVAVVVALFVSVLMSSCDLNRESRPSVLVIAVEGLGFESLNCDSVESGDLNLEGLRAFCEEAVRFTHAYATSTLAQPNLASLMTGLYPLDHGVRHNGSDFLSARFKTVAEGALTRGYHTSFISGGPPVWRKSGLAQGFEVFDDSIDLAPGLYYRPAEEVFQLARLGIEEAFEGQPFLSFVYLADLQFPGVATRTNEGVIREQSASAQLEEVVESLAAMVTWLKRERRWHSTNVVLVGLNSLRVHEGDEESTPLSLRSSSVQITLFIKPARSDRDNQIQWGVDRNVSLVDVGRTMFVWLGLEALPSSLPELEAQSLVSALSKPEPHWKENRLILSESGWADWLEGAGIRWSIRQNQFLYVHDRNPLIFNTLTDRLENLPLRADDPLWISVNADILNLLGKIQSPPFSGIQSHWREQIKIARELWLEGNSSRHPRDGDPWLKWYLHHALQRREWRDVKRYSQALGEPLGTYVASKHLGEPVPMPRNPCVRLILGAKGDKNRFLSECEDEQALALHLWHTASGDDEKLRAQERFLRAYVQYWTDQELGRLNFLNELHWDVNRDWPKAPQPVDFLLTLKEFEPYARKALAALAAKDLRL
ncbi:MAG: sulfatase-like hydrolase/transferase [Bdellovibrionales bacterium]